MNLAKICMRTVVTTIGAQVCCCLVREPHAEKLQNSPIHLTVHTVGIATTDFGIAYP